MKRLNTLQPGQLVMLAYYCGILVAVLALVAVIAAENADAQAKRNRDERQKMLDELLRQHAHIQTLSAVLSSIPASAVQAAAQPQAAAPDPAPAPTGEGTSDETAATDPAA